MSTSGGKPPTLPGCSVLPPMKPAEVSDGQQGNKSGRGADGWPKGKSNRRKTADRFGILNTFVDVGMIGLARVEVMTWFVLYRDTRDGIACTTQKSIATRVGCSERAVTTALGKLRRRGLLVQVFQGGINRGPSRYRVLPVPKPPKELGKPAS